MSTRRRRRRRLNTGGFIIGLAILGGLYWASKSGALAVALTTVSEVAAGWARSLFFPGAR